MSDFLESEAEEITEMMVTDERIMEELKDIIDDGPEEESDGEDSDTSRGAKRKRSDDEELDDRLEDEDYELLEENLGVKVDRKEFKRLKRIEDEGSEEGGGDEGQQRDAIARDLFSDDDDRKRSERSQRLAPEAEQFGEEEEEGEYSDDDDGFIVDDDGRPIGKKKRPIFSDAY